MENNTIVINVDGSAIDTTMAKVEKLSDVLREAVTLLEELTQTEANLTVSVDNRKKCKPLRAQTIRLDPESAAKIAIEAIRGMHEDRKA